MEWKNGDRVYGPFGLGTVVDDRPIDNLYLRGMIRVKFDDSYGEIDPVMPSNLISELQHLTQLNDKYEGDDF